MPSATPMRGLLHEHLAAGGSRSTVQGSARWPSARSRGSVLGLLETAHTGYRRADVLRATGKLPVVTFSPAPDGSAAPVPLPLWERLTREAGVVAGDDWQDRLTSHQQSIGHRLQYLGCGCISASRGVKYHEVKETFFRWALIERASEVVFVADHTKLGRESSFSLGKMPFIDTLVTTRAPEGPLVERLSDSGVQVEVV